MDKQKKGGIFISYVNIIAKNGINLLFTPFLLMNVGQSDFGLFQMMNAILMNIYVLFVGFSSAYIKFYFGYSKKNKEEMIKRLNGMYLIIFLAISLISLLLGILIYYRTESIFGSTFNADEIKIAQELTIIMTANIAISFISTVFDSYIIVKGKFIYKQVRQLLQTLLTPIISIVLIMNGVGVIAIGWSQLFITFFFLILNIRYCFWRLHMKVSFKVFEWSVFKGILYFSLFVLLGQIVDIVNNNIPTVFLGMKMGTKEVAIFSITNQIRMIFIMLSSSLSSVFIPKINRIIQENQNSQDKIMELMVKIGRVQLAILLCILGGFIILGKFFINLWVGGENEQVYALTLIMIFPSIIPLAQNIGIEIQKAMNKHFFRSTVYFAFAIFNIVITFLGIKYFYLIGATFGFVFSMCISNGLIMNWYYHTKLNLNMKKYWIRVSSTMIPFTILISVFLLLKKYIVINSVGAFCIAGIVYVCFYGILYYLVTATDYEKNLLRIKKCSSPIRK